MSLEDISGHPDNSLLKVIAWLSLPKVKNSKDIRKLNKDNIFDTSLEDYKKMLKKK